MRRNLQTVKPVLPVETGVHEGLSYSLWLPERAEAIRGAIVILHGAGSCKENHHDFARAALGAGFAGIAFDQRGHGSSQGPLGAGVLDDIAAITELLRSRMGDGATPVALRGSSMGGYLAILAAPVTRAAAVVAICPADPEGLRRGLASGELGFDADVAELGQFISDHDLHRAVEALAVPLLVLHAEGDERVPVQHSRELAQRISAPGSRLITVPGGHHRSVQHDPELCAVSLRWLERALAPGH